MVPEAHSGYTWGWSVRTGPTKGDQGHLFQTAWSETCKSNPLEVICSALEVLFFLIVYRRRQQSCSRIDEFCSALSLSCNSLLPSLQKHQTMCHPAEAGQPVNLECNCNYCDKEVGKRRIQIKNQSGESQERELLFGGHHLVVTFICSKAGEMYSQ